MKNDYYQSPKPSWLMRQFWKAAGADRYLLERSTYSDQIKYFCLGGIVIATGVMAGLAGGYAIYTIFEPKDGIALNGMLTAEDVANGKAAKDFIHMPTFYLSVVFGTIWGIIIYNIDRFIVTSTGKGDGTEAITRQEIKSALPRIVMGLIIALTISKPVEIRMFKNEIDREITKAQKQYKENLDSTTRASSEKKLKLTRKEYFELNEKFEKRRADLSSQRNKLELEAEGLSTNGIPGRGPAWRDKNSNLEKMEAEFEIEAPKINQKLSELEKTIKDVEHARDSEYMLNKKEAESMDGLLLRLKLAHQTAGFWISLFITLLFVVIELTPIFFKMMLIKGPYDYMDENTKELARAEYGIEIEYDFYSDKEGMERHKIINHSAELKKKEKLAILKAQEEINEQIIDEWKKRKLEEAKENPEKFIDEK
jgi:hypothetical protein